MGSINTTKGKNDAFADNNVGGSKYLPIGQHKNVRIVEAYDVLLGQKESPALQLVFQADNGKQAKATIFYTQNVYVNKQRTEDTELSWKLRALAGALVKDSALRQEVFGMCYDSTALFEKLIGFRCDIEISYPKKGHAILRDSETETIGIYDLGEDSALVKTFESFEDARDYMAEENLARAYTEVSAFSRVVTDGGEDINARLIQNFIKTAGKPAKGKGTVSPLGSRATGTSM
jgi:hypothetical protein